TEFVVPVKDIAERAKSYAMASAVADGMDFFDVQAKAADAIARARRGEGPTLLECKTYRFAGHYVGDGLAYRPKDAAETWITRRDPIRLFVDRVLAEKTLTPADLERVDAEVARHLDDAVKAAEAAPEPSAEDLLRDVYVDPR